MLHCLADVRKHLAAGLTTRCGAVSIRVLVHSVSTNFGTSDQPARKSLDAVKGCRNRLVCLSQVSPRKLIAAQSALCVRSLQERILSGLHNGV